MTETKFHGKCHCGKVEFEFLSDLSNPFICNCSFCKRRAAIVHKVPDEKFRVIIGKQKLSKYGSRAFSKHYFCSNCGNNLFTKIVRNNEKSVAVNLNCCDEIDVSKLSPSTFDGANLL